MKKGKITKIVGPVVDVDFGEGTTLPPIYNALKVRTKDREITFEVVKHLEPGKARAIALDSTDGLSRGMEIEDMGKMIEVPVPEEVKKAAEKAAAPDDGGLQTKMSKYKLVGVAWLDVPESATVMLEDIAKHETHFLKEGDKIEDVKVKTIYTDRVVFSYANEEITIKL